MKEKKPWSTILTIVLVALLIILCCGTIFATLANRKTLANEISSVVKTEEAQYYSPTPVPTTAPTATTIPTLAPTVAAPTTTPTPVPTTAPTATKVPTATAIPLRKIAICPEKSLGVWFDAKVKANVPLVANINPYPGVSCQYEAYFESEDVTIQIPDGYAALVADWIAGVCGSGVTCEGVWFGEKSFTLPKGMLVNVYLYPVKYAAQGRFPTFACEYVADTNQKHTEKNIRVPKWLEPKEAGSILNHMGCVGARPK